MQLAMSWGRKGKKNHQRQLTLLNVGTSLHILIFATFDAILRFWVTTCPRGITNWKNWSVRVHLHLPSKQRLPMFQWQQRQTAPERGSRRRSPFCSNKYIYLCHFVSPRISWDLSFTTATLLSSSLSHSKIFRHMISHQTSPLLVYIL